MNTPMQFPAEARSEFGIEKDWAGRASVGAPDLKFGVPKEFGGPGTGLSPEDLFVSALVNCYIATFKVIAQNSKIQFARIEGSGVLTLDKDSGGETWFTSALLKFNVSGAANVERTQRLMERVSKQCMVINSVKTAVTFELKAEAKDES